MANKDHHAKEKSREYWKSNIIVIRVLLSIWAFSSLGCGILLVEPLNKLKIGQAPLGFWMAQQGSIYVFVALIFAYAFLMDRLDYGYARSKQSMIRQKEVEGD